jgi:hypothetical protein
MSFEDRFEALTPYRDTDKVLLQMKAEHTGMRTEHRENERQMIANRSDIRDAVVPLTSIAAAH